ncbi:hypothetical protein NQZ79_g2253 [Umbelopsis isabellina]|nr:hypothetical protein NQZ79_g2253 [Umbelopsis isabellina]
MLRLTTSKAMLQRQCFAFCKQRTLVIQCNPSLKKQWQSTKRAIQAESVSKPGPEFMSKYYQPRKSEIMDFLYSHQQRPIPTSKPDVVIANCPHCMKVKRNSFAAHIDLQHGNYSCRTCQSKGTWQEYTKALRKKKGETFKTFSVSDIRGDRKSAQFSRATYEIENYTKELENSATILDNLSKDTAIQKDTLLTYRVGLASYASPDSKLAVVNGEASGETQCITYPQTTYTYHDDREFVIETTRLKACRLDDVQSPVAYDPIAPVATGLFGYHVAPSDADTVVITRNELDAMAVFQATGLPGVALPTSVYQLPQTVLPLLERFSKIYLWLDDDVDGQLAAETFAHKLGESRCSIVNTRMGDAQGPLNAHQALLQQKDLNHILSTSSALKHDQIIDFHELRDEVYREFLSPEQARGVQSVDLPALNAVLKGHRPGELTILTGPTGVGKTTIISQLSMDFCKSGVTTLWGSFEILNKRLAKKMMCQFAEKDLSQHPQEFDIWADKFEQLPLYFLKFFGSTSIKDVLQACQHAVYAYDVRHIILDNLQFMLSQQGRSSLDRWELQDEAVAELRRFATSKDVHITLVVHPRKENAPALDINSVFGSAKVTQEADNVIIIQKNSQGEDLRFLDIKKNRQISRLYFHFFLIELESDIRGYTQQEMNDLKRRTQGVQRRSYDYDDNNYNLAANMVQDTF